MDAWYIGSTDDVPPYKTQRNPLIRYDTDVSNGLHHLAYTNNGVQRLMIIKKK